MKNSISKTKMTAVITIALLMASATLMAMPVQPAEAQLIHIGTTPTDVYGYPDLGPLPPGITPDVEFDKIAFLGFRPNPIGVGQSLLVNIWTSPGTHHALYMHDYKVTLQKPDGTTVVVGPINSYLGDCTAWFEFVVDQVGTWKLKFESPGTYIPAGTYVDRPGVLTSGNLTMPISMYYKPASTDWQELEVIQEPVLSWPPSPLPTDYWTRPISPENREWWTISGYYPWSGVYYYPGGRMLYPSNYRYTAYVQAPNTAHIAWKRMDAISGLVGADTYNYALSSSGSTPQIIYAGRLYNSYSKPGSGKSVVTYWKCTDLRTGELIWERPLEPGESAPVAVLLEPPGASVVAGAVSASWSIYLVAITDPSGSTPGRIFKYDPWTGRLQYNLTGQNPGLTVAQSGQIAPGSFSSILFNYTYVYSLQTITPSPRENAYGDYRLIKWDIRGSTNNFASRILSNITYPMARSGIGAIDYEEGVAIQGDWGPYNYLTPERGWCLGSRILSVDLNTGNVLYDINSNNTLTECTQTPASAVADRGRFAMAMQGGHWNCYDARTGRKLWESDLAGYPWGSWWAYATASYDFNESKSAIIGCAYDGIYAIDWDNGKILWHYSSPDVPFESPYGGTQAFFTGVLIADGKIYAYNGEHSPTQPITRGWKIHCINATTGEGIWKITGPMSPGAVADGYLTASNSYDGYMYVFGKGKSQTTVTASPKTIAKGAAVLIEGTVLDQSPSQPDTPCVSKGSMATQMEYLHMQHPIDGLYHNETITGVPVILTAIGSDGTVIDIGTTTTNGYGGTFGMAWTPPNEDTYTIMASFNSDDSYGSSMATTAVAVGPAPASPTPTPTEQPQAAPDNTPTIIGTGIAIIIAVAIATILILRKRP